MSCFLMRRIYCRSWRLNILGDSLSSTRLLRVAVDAERAAAKCTEGAAVLQAARILRAAVGVLLESANFPEQRINAEESLQNKDWQDASRRLEMP